MENVNTTRTKPTPQARAASLLVRGGILLLLWWILTEGKLEDPLFILCAVALALAASYRLCPLGAWRWWPLAVIGFLPYFLWNSLLGGMDVALRAFRPSMPLNPEIFEFPLRVPEKPALLLVWTISLLPGTASVYLEKDKLYVHVLDSKLPVIEKLRDLERRLEPLCRGSQ